MGELKDSLCIDLVMRGVETVKQILDMSGNNSIVIKSLIIKDFITILEEWIKKMNVVYCPSSNSFHQIMNIDILDKSIEIFEDEEYETEKIRECIIRDGLLLDVLSVDFVKTINDLINNDGDRTSQIYGNYLAYKAFVSFNVYHIITKYVIENPKSMIPFIDPDDDFGYITLSINLNSWWDSIANKNSEKIRDTTSIEERYIIPWLRPIIITRPNLSFRIFRIGIVDMAPLLLNEGAE